MKKHKKLVFTILIPMMIIMFVACDADQESKADEIVGDKPASTETESPSQATENPEVVDASITGKYINLRNPNSYLVLNADGTYLMSTGQRQSNRSKPYQGTFSLIGDELRMTLNEKPSTTMQLEDGAIVSKSGQRWEKQ